MPSPHPAICLTIAGSDSGGGAGIQADLKTFAALGVHGLSAITALTAQNTQGVTAVHPVPVKHLAAELDAVFDDFPIAAVKTGMLGDARTVRRVAHELARRQPRWLVVDPVMIATSGARLLDRNAVKVLIDNLIPLADVLTPNLPEAEALTGIPIRNGRDGERAASMLREFGAHAVLLKGGHGGGREVVDRWFDARGNFEIRNHRLPFDAHGTGCTLSAALAAELAKGRVPRIAARRGFSQSRYDAFAQVVHALEIFAPRDHQFAGGEERLQPALFVLPAPPAFVAGAFGLEFGRLHFAVRADVFEEPQVKAREMLRYVPHPSGVDVPQVASPMRFAESPLQTQSAPPLLGQHSDDILAELGYSRGCIDSLRAAGAI